MGRAKQIDGARSWSVVSAPAITRERQIADFEKFRPSEQACKRRAATSQKVTTRNQDSTGMGISTFDIEHSIFDISDAVQAPRGGRTRKMSNVEYSMSNFQVRRKHR